jgi:hypothetical protein
MDERQRENLLPMQSVRVYGLHVLSDSSAEMNRDDAHMIQASAAHRFRAEGGRILGISSENKTHSVLREVHKSTIHRRQSLVDGAGGSPRMLLTSSSSS